VPRDAQKPYDMRAVVRELLDDGETLELQPQFGRSMLTCSEARRRNVAVSPTSRCSRRFQDRDAADKAARFLQVADAFHAIFLAATPASSRSGRARQYAAAAARMFMAQMRGSRVE
jgi:acetyl-CoA carboxylase carboxyltransferase component